mgnify:CR=1 FL=1
MISCGITFPASRALNMYIPLFSHCGVSILCKLVVAPKTLLFQWETELEKKFCVSDFRESEVLVKSINDLENFKIDEFELLVVDEAHNYVKESIPNVLKNLAENTPHVLFLSATPALSDDKVLLNLLRLLDPENYNHLSIFIVMLM